MCVCEKGPGHFTDTKATSQLWEAGIFIKQNTDGGGPEREASQEEEGLVSTFAGF